MDEHNQQQDDFGGEDVPEEISAASDEHLSASEPAWLKKRIGRRKLLIGAGIAGGGLLVGGVVGYKVLESRFPPPNFFKLTGPLTTPQDIVIYTKGQLDANWQNWSRAPNDLHALAYPYQNQPTIRVGLNGRKAFTLHDALGPLDLTDFGYLQCSINGGSGSDQQAFARFVDAQGHATPQTLLALYTEGGRILSNVWKLTRIPLKVMKANNISISGVMVQDASGGTQPDIFIADLRLIYAPDLTPPRIAQALALDLNTITLIFDTRMIQAEAEATRFYSITGQESAYRKPQAPLSAHYHPVTQSVSLVAPITMRAHKSYAVTIGPVHDKHHVALPNASHARVTAQPLTLIIDAAQGRHTISPYIYGVAGAPTTWLAQVRPRLHRWGGNQTTRYNWKLGNAFSASRDYYFENVNNGLTSPADQQPSGVVDEFIAANKATGAETLLTVPTIGWVARDDHSRSTNVPHTGGPPIFPGADAIRGYNPTKNRRRTSVPSQARKKGRLADPPDLNDPMVAQDEWVSHLTHRFGPAANGGVRFYAMDNEPDLWFFTHTDIRPVEVSYDQMRDVFLDYATAVKSVDPTALVTGPVVSGWSGYLYSALDRSDDNFRTKADYHHHRNHYFLPWWLSQVRAHDKRTGQRSLDVLDVHYYPQTQGVFQGDTDLQTNAERLISLRSLWDPAYTDPSWIGDNIQLIPRMKKWIQEYYPGTQLGITEWNFGADNTISGALAIAEALGIFGREGVDLACYWTYPDFNTPGYAAMKLFMNFDDNNSPFGFTSVHAASSHYDLISCYAAVDHSSNVLVMVLNKSQVADLTPDIGLAHIQAHQAQVYQISEDKPQITRLADAAVLGARLKFTFPASSITLLRLVR